MLIRIATMVMKVSLVALATVLLLISGSQPALSARCVATPWDEIGPFYRPNAPVRNSIGQGYLVHGTVRSAADCRPLENIRIQVWQAGPDGTYDDNHRATLVSDREGRYRLQTGYPPPYGSRPSHIHILVDAKGFEGLITQHYPRPGAREATLDLVLVPEIKGREKARNPLGR